MSAVGSALVVSVLSAAISSALPARPRDNGMPMTALWSQGERGAWFDPSDLSTLFQDAAGTTPVTAVEQPVGLMLDKRLGLVRGAELVANGDFANGTTGWSAVNATLAVVNGELEVTGAASTARAGQSINLTANKAYEVRASARPGTSGVQTISFFSAGFANNLTFAAVNGQIRGVFVPTASGLGEIWLRADTGTAFFDNISVRELPGNHARQTTTTARPLLSARKNILLNTASTLGPGSTDWGGVAVTGTLQADGSSLIKRTTAASGGAYAQSGVILSSILPIGTSGSVQIKVKKGAVGNLYGLRVQGTYPDRVDAVIDLDTGVAWSAAVSFTGLSVSVDQPDADGFYTLRMSFTPAVSAAAAVYHGPARSATGGWETADGIQYEVYAKEPQLEYGSAATRYQRVNTATDYDWAGFPLYLKFDGVDDWLYFNIPGLALSAEILCITATGVTKAATTAYAVAMGNDTPTSAHLLCGVSNTAARSWTRDQGNTGSRSVSAGALSTGVPALTTLLHTVAQDSCSANGGAATVNTSVQVQPSALNTFRLGSNAGNPAPTAFVDVRSYGVVVREGTIPTRYRDVERILAGKIGVTLQ